MYTKQELMAAVFAHVPDLKKSILGGRISLPIACKHVAMECFIHQYIEDNNIQIVRAALLDLETLGHFNYV